MEIYREIFGDWAAVQHKYNMGEPEPEEVIVAYYNYEDYSGSSIVIYRNGTDYFVNEGGHCSCDGLEGQWDPTKYESKELLLACLKNSYVMDGLPEVIEKLESN